MPWMILTPRELEDVTTPVTGDIGNGRMLKEIQKKLKGDELELTDLEMRGIDVARKNWRGGYIKAFDAIRTAAKRHD